ncbi:MAG: hypothetical protein Q3983_09890 [Capnocytophaga sp.]|nr:hypothetical protein [Capnocytophaga sp.]
MIINILIIFILINAILKLSFWKFWQTLIFGLIVVFFLWEMYFYAINQSQVTIDNMLNNSKILSDITVLLTIESMVCMGFCFLALRSFFLQKESKWYKILKWYSGLLIFPVLFYVLTQCIFYFSGVDFQLITIILATIVFVFIVLGAYAIRKLLPEQDFRLEIHFLTSIFITILGLISTADGQIIYKSESEPLNLKVLALTFLLFLCLFFLGFFINKFYWKIRK